MDNTLDQERKAYEDSTSLPPPTSDVPSYNSTTLAADNGVSNELDISAQRPEALTGKAEELWVQFWDTVDMELFAEIVTLHSRALQLSQPGHPYRARALLNLAFVLIARERISSETIDMASINEVIQLGREALSLWRADNYEKGNNLVLLGEALMTRFALIESDDTEAVSEAICFYRESLPFFPARSNPYREVILDRFANALQASWRELENASDLPEAVAVRREILSRHPDDGRERTDALSKLFVVLGQYYAHAHDITILDEFIFVCRELQRLLPIGDRVREHATRDGASALMARFRVAGNMEDLMEASALHNAALEILPSTSSDRVQRISELANTHLSRFMHTGNADALAEAIALFRNVLSARPLGDSHRGEALDNLASALRMHYQQTGNVENLMEGIKLHEEAITLHPPEHPSRRVSLTALANGLTMLLEHRQDLTLLDRILSARRESLSLTPLDHLERGAAVSNLATTLTSVFRRDEDVATLTEAISLHREALQFHKIGHPSRIASVVNLLDALTLRHRIQKNVEDIDEGLALILDEMSNLFDGHPARSLLHFIAADLFLANSTRYSWEGALHHLVSAAHDSAAPARQRADKLQRALKLIELSPWVITSEGEQPRQLLGLYSELISLLPRVAHFGLDASSRLREVGLFEDWIYLMAATCAIHLSEYAMAVEILEESKSVFWEQTLRLRAPLLDKLPASDKRELQTLLHKLERDNLSSIRDRIELEENIEERRRINKRLENTIDEIRARPGFERFLTTPLYEDLTVAAAHGPVVLLFPSLNSCLAIFIDKPGGNPRCAELQVITPRKLRYLRLQLPRSGLRDGSQVPRDDSEDRGMRIAPPASRDEEAYDILEAIWALIVGPVLLGLDLPKAKGRDRPRLHWIPFGDFSYLPLHAAGVYRGRNRESIADYVVSSYSPSLSALIKSRQNFSPTGIPRENLKALLIAESNAPFLDPLDSVEDEVDVVASLALSASVSVVNDISAMNLTETVLNDLPSVHILHLACHGCQDRLAPLQSHFALRDGNLDISAIMRLDLPDATLAFLSACETAKGDPTQPDQAVHLAASMLFCGFRSVIATMWAMGDVDGPIIAQKVYEELFSRENLELDDIPYALEAAVQELRDQEVSPSRWATFIHMGA